MSINLAIRPRNNAPLVRHALNGATMGTRYSAVLFAPEGVDIKVLDAALFEAVDRVDRQMSTWKPDSDLNRLNAAPVGDWIAIPRELATVLAASLRIGRTSNGCFDIGVGDLVAAWGFGCAGPEPDANRIVALAKRARSSTLTALELDEAGSRARKHAPLSLDLSGIAKGYGVDELARVMNAFAIPSWLVGIDGEMRAKGVKPDGSPWAVGLERPQHGTRDIMSVIELTDMAVATSGNYRHWRDVDGKTLSHTMNPKTGAPLDNNLASVSVLAATAMEADAWATVLMVLGDKAGRQTAKMLGIDAIFVLRDGSVSSTL
jgi:thiamine biosynthesis lipoprotein